MAKTDNYSLYECDRCGKQEYLAANSPNRSDWRSAQRVDSSDVPTSYLLCRSCAAEYKAKVSEQDAEFRRFMAAGKEQ